MGYADFKADLVVVRKVELSLGVTVIFTLQSEELCVITCLDHLSLGPGLVVEFSGGRGLLSGSSDEGTFPALMTWIRSAPMTVFRRCAITTDVLSNIVFRVG